MKKIIVICPGGSSTGGVELLHQLANEINAINNNSRICYYPFDKKFSSPDGYKKYNCKLISYGDIDLINDIIVLPETYTYLSSNFSLSNIYLWWMSVDNYINSSVIRYALSNRFLPWRYLHIKKQKSLFEKMGGQLCQSEYARDFLSANGLYKTIPISDYINEDYIVQGTELDYNSKKNIVAYNPAKGIEQTREIMECLNDVEFVAIKNMTRYEVIDLLCTAKIYMDFGNHPGKDRIPREAAVLGCCIITNKRGSAANSLDISIPSRFKIDDKEKFFARKMRPLVNEIFNNFSECKLEFDSYREIIFKEKLVFSENVKSFLQIAVSS